MILLRVKRKFDQDPDVQPPNLVAVPMNNNRVIKKFKLNPGIKVEEGYDVYMSIETETIDPDEPLLENQQFTLLQENEVDFLQWESADEDENAGGDEDLDSNDEDYFANDYPDEEDFYSRTQEDVDYCYYENSVSEDERHRRIDEDYY
jgi:hypothetical protein